MQRGHPFLSVERDSFFGGECLFSPHPPFSLDFFTLLFYNIFMEITFSPREFVDKTKRLLRTPTVFYKSIEKEKNWKEAFTYSIAISIIAAFFGIIELTLLAPLLPNELSTVLSDGSHPQLLDILPAFFVSAIIVILLGFVWAGALHIWLKVCRVKGDYWSAYKAFTYSRAPLSIFGWIPYVGGLFGLYSIYLLIVGISVHYKVSRKKAFILVIIPLALLFILQAVLFTAATQLMP